VFLHQIAQTGEASHEVSLGSGELDTEHGRDLANRKFLPRTFGWKHTLPPLDFLESRADARNTLFIITGDTRRSWRRRSF